MNGLLFDDITAYVKDLISRELGEQIDFIDKQKVENHSDRPSESGERQDERTPNTTMGFTRSVGPAVHIIVTNALSVWSLLLRSDSGRPALISCVASRRISAMNLNLPTAVASLS